MTIRGIGLILIWLGTLALVAVLQHRIRHGAWRIENEAVPPVGRWAVGIAASGMVLAAVGVVMVMLDRA
jgi:hypothetical protein